MRVSERVVFLSGEPGIGKTRLAREFMREAAGTDAVILYGRCVEDPVVPYEPFVQVLQQLARGVPSAPDTAESVQSRLVALVPALSGGLSGAEPPPPPDSATRRLVLFEGVRSALRAAATGLRPLLLVLDDLQWADLDSVRLLRYLTREVGIRPHSSSGIFRDTDLDEPDGPLQAAIANLHSDGPLERIELCPFGPAQVRELAEESLGRPVSVEDEQWISAASGGNPFLAQEVIALVNETGHPPIGQVVPVGAREVISRRLSRLSSDCREVLTRASVLGGSADVALLEALWDGGGTTLSSSLDEAMRRRSLPKRPATTASRMESSSRRFTSPSRSRRGSVCTFAPPVLSQPSRNDTEKAASVPLQPSTGRRATLRRPRRGFRTHSPPPTQPSPPSHWTTPPIGGRGR